MTGRSLSELSDMAVVRLVTFRLAIVEAMSELRPRDCPGCRAAKAVLERIDRPAPTVVPHAPPPLPVVVPAPRRPEPEDDMVMTAFDVALAFGVDTKSVCRWVTAGRIPPDATFLDAQGRRRFHTAEIDKLL